MYHCISSHIYSNFQAARSSNVPIKQEEVFELSDSETRSSPPSPPFTVSQVTRQPTATGPRVSLPSALVKREAPASTILRKHQTASAFGALKEDISLSPPRVQELKKSQLVPRKTPLASVNGNMPDSQQHFPKLSPSTQTVDDARTLLWDIQTQLSAAQTHFERLQRKPSKSKADLTKISHWKSEVQRLSREKWEVNASIPSVKTLIEFPPMPALNPVLPKLSDSPLAAAPVAHGSNYNLPKMETDDEEDEVISGPDCMSWGLPDYSVNNSGSAQESGAFIGPQAKADEYVAPPHCIWHS